MDLLIRDILLLPVNAAQDLITKGWYSSNFRAIRDLVQDPGYRAKDTDPYEEDADPNEPVIEVVVGEATVEETNDFITPTFVRLSMDGENLGETSLFKHGPYTRPVWNERFLLHPRGSRSMKFEIIDHRNRLRGQCILGTQSLWRAAVKTGGRSVKAQLNVGLNPNCGHLTVHCRPWDGLPPDRPWWEATGPGSKGKQEEDSESSEPDLFAMLDKDGDGVLSKEELQAAMHKSQVLDTSPKMSRQGPPTAMPQAQGGPPLLLPISSRSSIRTQSMTGSLGPMQPAVAPGVVSSLHPGVSVRSQQTFSQPGSPLQIPRAMASPVKPEGRHYYSLPSQASPMRNASMSMSSVDVDQQGFVSLPAQIPGSPLKVQSSNDALGPAVVPSRSGAKRPLEARRISPEKEMSKSSPATVPSMSARLKGAGFMS